MWILIYRWYEIKRIICIWNKKKNLIGNWILNKFIQKRYKEFWLIQINNFWLKISKLRMIFSYYSMWKVPKTFKTTKYKAVAWVQSMYIIKLASPWKLKVVSEAIAIWKKSVHPFSCDKETNKQVWICLKLHKVSI